MNHTDAFAHLQEYFDGALSPGVRREIEVHLAGCTLCRDELSSLGALLDTVVELRSTLVEPPRDLWPEIAKEIGGRAGDATGRDGGPARRGARARSLGGRTGIWGALGGGRAPRIWLVGAGAAVAVLLVLAGLGGKSSLLRILGTTPSERGGDGASVSSSAMSTGADGSMARELSRLSGAVESTRGSVRPAGPAGPADTTAATPSWRLFDEGLAVLDQAIKDSRTALERDPSNPVLQKSLLAAYQRQLELIRWANRVVRQG
jgi:hypothetical protein